MTLATSFLLIAIMWGVGAVVMLGGMIAEVGTEDDQLQLKKLCSTARIVGAFLTSAALVWGGWIIFTMKYSPVV